MANASTVLNRLLTALSVSDPTWDTTIGSATYKILESVAQEIANATNNSTLLTYGYDVTSKFGTELDAFVNLFGINRQQGTRAVGTVTFSSSGSASQNYDIPIGTQVYASGNANIGFATTTAATLTTGNTSIIVPVASLLPGSYNNLSANSITNVSTPLVGVTTASNQYAMINGSDTETDVQLQQRFLNTAFSNFSGTATKFQSITQQNPDITQNNVIGTQMNYLEYLQVITVLSGNSNFVLGLQTQAQLALVSGSLVASGYLGTLQPNVTIPISSTTPANRIAPGSTVFYDGTNYNLSSVASGNGYLNIAYTYSGSSPTTLTNASTPANIITAISGMLNSVTLNYNNAVTTTVTGTISGSQTVPSGLNVTFNQSIPWNVVVLNSTNTTATNTIISQIPDSQYCYPAGNEQVGINIGNSNQQLFTRNIDYNYIQASGNAPLHLKVTFIPSSNNAPNTYTGASVQMSSEYIPISSRVVVSGENTGSPYILNPNYVDVYINSTVTSAVTEQIVMVTGNVFVASGTGTYSIDKFILPNGGTPTTTDYYIGISQTPLANFPYQLISGNAPSFMTFGSYNFPICLQNATSSSIPVSGSAGSNILTTMTTITGLFVGEVAVNPFASVGISGIGVGNYITSLTPGNPNTITLANNLALGVSGSLAWAAVAYPVYDNTNTAGSILDISGIALNRSDPTSSYGSSYPNSVPYQVGTFTHSFYSDVVATDALAQQSRVVGTNVLVHEASWVNIVLNLSLIYTTSANPVVTNNAIQSAVAGYLQSIPFGSTVSLSSLLQSVYGITGVQAVRITTITDNPNNYGVQVVNVDGSKKGSPYNKDILLNSNQIPNLFSINYNVFGLNNY